MLSLTLAPYFGQSQSSITLSHFSFGYYHQRTTALPMDYTQFVNGSESKNILPEALPYKNSLKNTVFDQPGLNFSFHFNIIDKENRASSPHFFNLIFRNGFIRANGFNQQNEIFTLETNTLNKVGYHMQLESEVFGIGTGYHHRLVNLKKLKFYAGADFVYDFAVSKKLIAVSDTTLNDGPFGNGINHKYFLKQTGSFYLLPKLTLDVPITENFSLGMQYSIGIGHQKIEASPLSPKARNFQFHLKFTI